MKTTKALNEHFVLESLFDMCPKGTFLHELDMAFTKLCDYNQTTNRYLFAKIDRQRIILNLNNGMMYSWYGDFLVENAWVNRPFICQGTLTAFFRDIIKDLESCDLSIETILDL